MGKRIGKPIRPHIDNPIGVNPMTRLTTALADARATLADARDEARFWLFEAGVPAFLLTELTNLKLAMGRTEYSLKTQFHQAPLWILQETAQTCHDWLSD